jgi:phosphoribosylanthranilate isomerase
MTPIAPVRVKICGITRAEDALAAASAGADAVGLNFVGGPRRLDVATAEAILDALPPMCTPVALVDVSGGDVPNELLDLLGRFWVSHLQLYGRVEPATVARLRRDGFHVIVVQRVTADFPRDIQAALDAATEAPPSAILLDSAQPGKLGGTGETLDWTAIARAKSAGELAKWPPLILAGGLNAENVAEAIHTVRPWGVDVSSGVESAVAVKDAARMAAFIAAVRGAG